MMGDVLPMGDLSYEIRGCRSCPFEEPATAKWTLALGLRVTDYRCMLTKTRRSDRPTPPPADCPLRAQPILVKLHKDTP